MSKDTTTEQKLNTKIPDDLLDLESVILWAKKTLDEHEVYCGHGTDNTLDEAAWLVLYAVGLSPVDPIPDDMGSLTPKELNAIEHIIEQRVVTRKPAGYLTNEVWFAGLPFFVDERVLVPRSPIAEMIHREFAPWLNASPKRILDLCTGSGCIGIACAYAFPDAQVVAADLSDDALDVASVNVKKHNLQNRVQLIKSDLLKDIDGKFDLIVSNPPYVDELDMSELREEYKQEPRLGLESGIDGLDATRVILSQAADYLNEDGVIVIEVGNSEEALMNAYPQLPFIWQEFEFGGHGVFVLNKADLINV